MYNMGSSKENYMFKVHKYDLISVKNKLTLYTCSVAVWWFDDAQLIDCIDSVFPDLDY
jgi:hypothetical protein